MTKLQSTPSRPLACALAAAAMMLLPGALSFAQDAAPDKVVATVDGKPITEGDLAIAAQSFGQELAAVPPAERRTALIQILVDTRLLSQAAEKDGLDKNEMVETRLAFMRDQTLRGEYLRSKVVAAVTDEAAKKRFDEEIAKFVADDEVHVSHILVKTEDEAKGVIADLDKGGDFAAIAKEKSQDPGSGGSGGDIGFIGKGTTVKPFEDAAYSLEIGKYTKAPVQTQFGWHVILLQEKRKQPPPTFEQEAARIRQEMVRDTVTSELDRLKAAAKVEIVPEAAPTPAPGTPAAPDAAPAPAQ